MDILPTAMLLMIFEYLSNRDLKLVMLVCRIWRNIEWGLKRVFQGGLGEDEQPLLLNRVKIEALNLKARSDQRDHNDDYNRSNNS